MRLRVGRGLAPAVAVIALLAASLPAASGAALPPRGQTQGWKLVWHDEFGGSRGTPPSSAGWLYDTGTGYGCAGCPAHWGTGEVETMTKSTHNVYLDGAGHLTIKPVRDAQGNWTSGRIETRRAGFAPPARGALALEASIRLPDVTGAAAAGYWPAFWMLGSAFRGTYLNWPRIGEVDVMESVDGLNKDFGTLHCGTAPGGPCHEFNGLGGSAPCTPTPCRAAFHTYRVEIDRAASPERIRWYLDGKRFWQVSSTQMKPTVWARAVHHAFFAILDVAIGGSFPDTLGGGSTPTESTASGVPMLVDYLRAYVRTG